MHRVRTTEPHEKLSTALMLDTCLTLIGWKGSAYHALNSRTQTPESVPGAAALPCPNTLLQTQSRG